MLEPWNDKSLYPPPVNTAPCEINFNLIDLKDICMRIIEVLSKQSPLHKESAIFSRLLYKFDKKFRNDIGYRNFKKVNLALRKYLALTLMKDVQNFIDILPANEEVSPYLPTKQMLEYILVRILTFSKLMYRIVICSKQAAIFYLNRIKLGESHWMCLMPYALLCRVWSMTLVLLQHSCKWYNKLYPFQNYLPYKGVNFLHNNYKLPIDLELWLDMKNLNTVGRFEWKQKLNINADTIMIEDNEGDLCQSILNYVSNINKETENCEEHDIKPMAQEISSNISFNRNNDLGEAVSRESFQQSLGLPPILTNPSVAKVRNSHLIENVTDRDSLQEFIENEETFRNQSSSKSLTRHLSFMQWQALKAALLKLDTTLINKRKLENKAQKIWQIKCLEYI